MKQPWFRSDVSSAIQTTDATASWLGRVWNFINKPWVWAVLGAVATGLASLWQTLPWQEALFYPLAYGVVVFVAIEAWRQRRARREKETPAPAAPIIQPAVHVTIRDDALLRAMDERKEEQQRREAAEADARHARQDAESIKVEADRTVRETEGKLGAARQEVDDWQARFFNMVKVFDQLLGAFNKLHNARTGHPKEGAGVKAPKTLRQLYDSEFENASKILSELVFSSDGTELMRVPTTVYREAGANAEFVGFYMGASPYTYELCQRLPEECAGVLTRARKDIITIQHNLGDKSTTHSSDLTFSGRVLVYHEESLSLQQLGALEALFKAKGLHPQFRGRDYMG